MSGYVYLLAEYDEGGIDDAVATLDRSTLIGLLEDYLPDGRPGFTQDLSGYREEAKATLSTLLERTDEDLSGQQGFSLTHGWGGVQFYVVKLTP